jgi:hypothetical protein
VAILEGNDLAKVLDHTGSYRPLFEVLAYSFSHGAHSSANAPSTDFMRRCSR